MQVWSIFFSSKVIMPRADSSWGSAGKGQVVKSYQRQKHIYMHLKFYNIFSSFQIFRCIHKSLNIDKIKTHYTVCI
jgi:hypothetical protein